MKPPVHLLLCRARTLMPSALALLAGLSPVSAQANLVQNGSFEAPALSGNFFEGIPSGWSGLGNGSSTDVLLAGYSGGSATDGSQYLDLVGNSQGTFPSGLSQSLHLLGGHTYRLAFDYAGGRYNDGSKTSGAELQYALGALASGAFNVDELNIFAAFGPTTPWQHFSGEVTVTVTGDYTLSFQTPGGAWGSPYLDNVSVNDLNSAPEPSSLILLGLAALAALAGLAARGRRGENRA